MPRVRLFSLLFVGSLIITVVSCQGQSPKLSVTREWWPDGTLRRESQYRGLIPEGEYRTWYENGHPYEIRHYVNGREEGLQQAWTPDGYLYLNYEMKNGRRYGYVNAQPCLPLVEERPGL